MESWLLHKRVIFAVLLIALPLAFQSLKPPEVLRAATTATFSVSPASQSVSPGDQVSIQVVMNPGSNRISGLHFRLWYGPQLTNPQVTLGSVFVSQLDLGGPILGGNYVEVALARDPGTIPYLGGSVTVATITFASSPSAAGTARLTFETANTQILDTSTVDVLSTAYAGMLTFPCPPIGDMDGDGDIDGFEVAVVANNYGCGRPGAEACPPIGDMDGDGDIDGFEVTVVADNYGCGR